jgi:Tfp pilus assembly protein PilV
MRTTITNIRQGRRSRSGFTLVDVMFGALIIGVMVVGLYVGFSQGFAVIQLARENLRATQILEEKMETVRLYTWDQVNTPNFIPATSRFCRQPDLRSIYDGRVTITNARGWKVMPRSPPGFRGSHLAVQPVAAAA